VPRNSVAAEKQSFV